MQHGEDLTVTVNSTDDAVLITVLGEMDAFTRTRLISAISRALNGRTGRVVVDVSGLSFIDAASYRALMALAEQAGSEHTSLVFRSPSRSFLRARELLDPGAALELDREAGAAG